MRKKTQKKKKGNNPKNQADIRCQRNCWHFFVINICFMEINGYICSMMKTILYGMATFLVTSIGFGFLFAMVNYLDENYSQPTPIEMFFCMTGLVGTLLFITGFIILGIHYTVKSTDKY